MTQAPQTVCELPEFRRTASRLLTEAEVSDLIYYLGNYPEAGELIRGSGGVRKVRWARESRGKSGGVRAITFFTGPELPLFLITVYGKGAKDNLSRAEVNEMRKLTDLLKTTYRSRR